MVCVCVRAHAGVHACVYVSAMWSPKDNLEEMVLSFHREGPKLKLHVVRLGSRCLYPLSHLSSMLFYTQRPPSFFFLRYQAMPDFLTSLPLELTTGVSRA